MSKKIVGTYGLHQTESNIWFLHQGKNALCDELSVYSSKDKDARRLEIQSPFKVVHANTLQGCPHEINLFEKEDLTKFDNEWKFLLRYDLFKLMLPLPLKQRLFFVQGRKTPEVLNSFFRLCTPTKLDIHPITTQRPRDWNTKLSLSNLMPLVLTGVNLNVINSFHSLIQLASATPRKILFVGSSDVIPPLDLHLLNEDYGLLVEKLNKIEPLPYERIGAAVLHKYMEGTLDERFTQLTGAPDQRSGLLLS